MELLKLIRKNQVAVYFVLAYGISWMCWVPLVLISNGLVPVELPQPVLLGALAAGISGPSLAAILLTGTLEGKNGLMGLIKRVIPGQKTARWYLAVLFLPLALGLASLGIYYLIGGRDGLPELLDPVTWLLFPGMFIFQLTLGGGLGEEFGWRGYALPRLLAGHSALVATLILGSLWCLWHLPAFFIAGTGQSTIPFLLFALGGLAFSFTFTWFYIRTGGSILIALLLHAAINTTMSALPIVSPLAGGESMPYVLFIGLFILTAIIVLASSPATFLKRPVQEKMVPSPIMPATGVENRS